jgi:hypothetical protein
MISLMFFIAVLSVTRRHAPEDSFTSEVRTRAEMWTSRLAEFVRDGAADAVVVALDMSTSQGRSR